MTIVSRSN